MKKILALTVISMLAVCTYAQARTQYDKSNMVLKSNSIRAERKAREEAKAAKNISNADTKTQSKTNFYELSEPPKSNFIQAKVREQNKILYGKE